MSDSSLPTWMDWALLAAPVLPLYLLNRECVPPEPPPVPSAAAIWQKDPVTLTARERMHTIHYRQALMAEHGAWQRQVRERRARRAELA